VDQIEGILEQIKREPFELPKLKIWRQLESIDDVRLDDFELIDYKSHDKIFFPVAV
jgi:thymidylate synthase